MIPESLQRFVDKYPERIKYSLLIAVVAGAGGGIIKAGWTLTYGSPPPLIIGVDSTLIAAEVVGMSGFYLIWRDVFGEALSVLMGRG